MAGRPLRPATDHRHGRPLPHRLANRPQDPLSATSEEAFPHTPHRDASSCGITPRFRGLPPTKRQVSHVFLTRPPRAPRRDHVRLACIRHAASVDPEPGSNSPPSLCWQRLLPIPKDARSRRCSFVCAFAHTPARSAAAAMVPGPEEARHHQIPPIQELYSFSIFGRLTNGNQPAAPRLRKNSRRSSSSPPTCQGAVRFKLGQKRPPLFEADTAAFSRITRLKV